MILPDMHKISTLRAAHCGCGAMPRGDDFPKIALEAQKVAIYSASGRRVSVAHEVDLPQGVYVVNTAEGTTKVLVP